jgi:hypothetical protein
MHQKELKMYQNPSQWPHDEDYSAVLQMMMMMT